MRSAAILAAVALAASLSACSRSLYLRVRGVPPLNVNDANESAPVDVRVYQLKDDGRFIRARVDDLWTRDQEVLGDDLIAQKKITVFPGPPQDVELAELPPDCRFIGILALFSKADDKGPRHLVIPAKGAKGRALLLSGSRLTLED